MADVIHANYVLLPIISRFGIRLGFGNRTIAEVCAIYGINADFFLEVVNSYHSDDYFPSSNMRSFSVSLIVDYLKNTHRHFLETVLPSISLLIDSLAESAQAENKEKMELVRKFFNDYQAELKSHTDHEDTFIYPYTLQVEEQFRADKPDPQFAQAINTSSIVLYAKEHGNVDEKLYDLKNIIIKYIPAIGDSNLQNSMLYEIFDLENDLKAHGLIEDKVLVPKIMHMETEILKRIRR
jgi:regulator of cell morphogenesis and NO signaling